MPAGRPRKPVAQKKLEGTYRKDRDLQTELVEKKVIDSGALFPKDKKISCPKTIKSKYVRSYWRKLTTTLISMQVLSPIDLPQLELMMNILEKLRSAQEMFIETELDSTENIQKYDFLLKTISKLTQMFNDLASKYYVSPSARSKLTLDVLNIEKTAQEIQKNLSGVDKVMQLRNRIKN